MRFFSQILLASLLFLASAAAARLAEADPVADFYAGKTLTIVVGSGVGGIYDAGARAMARAVGKFIPGHPNVIVQNMPGASSVRATEYLYNVAPKDGTFVGDVQPTIVLQKALYPNEKYEPEKFSWIGRLRQNTVYALVWHASPAVTVDQAKQHQVIFAANSASGYAAMLPWALDRMLGTQIKVITGYESETAEWLAIQRNEASGIGSGSLIDIPGHDWLAKGQVKIMYSNGTKRDPEAPDAPTLIELAKSPQDRQAMELLSTSSEIGETLLAPPSVPPDRIAALREAFAKMARDEQFITGAKRLEIDVDFLDGNHLQEIVAQASRAPPEVAERVKQLTQPMP
jgi:tripartite-type tricarboxylate transporter receptor subunit TctC